ncbi:MAG: glycosyltransferase family 2 protein [Phyllobacterium sp.]
MNDMPETVAILMGTWNGALYLDEQIDSLLRQTHPHIDVWVSDDGSSDDTLAILEQWRQRWSKGRFVVLKGPRNGFAENFRSMLTNRDIVADYYAFCDQDDIWVDDKLQRAIDWMKGDGNDVPLLHCSRTVTMSERGDDGGFSPLFTRSPSFENALVQSIAGGNTMTLNRRARDLVAKASRRSAFVSHDWWCYLLVTGAGGRVFYSSEPLVRYRQHGSNQVGANTGIRARLTRMRMLASGRFARWTDRNIEGLSECRSLLSDKASETFDLFLGIRQNSLWGRLSALRLSGIHRQTVTGQIGLYIAVALRRL